MEHFVTMMIEELNIIIEDRCFITWQRNEDSISLTLISFDQEQSKNKDLDGQFEYCNEDLFNSTTALTSFRQEGRSAMLERR